jgi:hypothetical protein
VESITSDLDRLLAIDFASCACVKEVDRGAVKPLEKMARKEYQKRVFDYLYRTYPHREFVRSARRHGRSLDEYIAPSNINMQLHTMQSGMVLHTPEWALLLLLQPGVAATFWCWEPYAALRYLQKPVDLIILQPGSHVMANPTQHLAAETINVDWFRFWLQGYEDPNPAKADQYKRWRELRNLQETEMGATQPN